MNTGQLQNLLELSERMLACALDDEWEPVGGWGHEQGALARELFVGVKECSHEERDILSKVVVITAQVTDLAERHKTILTEQLKQLKKSSLVQNVYLQNSE